jgi:hypothetical protein
MVQGNFTRMSEKPHFPEEAQEEAPRILVSDILSAMGVSLPPPPSPGSPEQTFRWAILETPFGQLLMSELDGRITSLCFLEGRELGQVLAGLRDRWHQARFEESPEALEPFRVFLVEALGGDVPAYHPDLWHGPPS